MDLDQGIDLCRSARKDLRKLLTALDNKSFYDAGHEVGHAAAVGIAFKDMETELEWLEQLMTVENYHTIQEHSWTIYDLVNYYDHLIDLVKAKDLTPERTPVIVDSLYKWRRNAGRLAQVLCQLEDSEPS